MQNSNILAGKQKLVKNAFQNFQPVGEPVAAGTGGRSPARSARIGGRSVGGKSPPRAPVD